MDDDALVPQLAAGDSRGQTVSLFLGLYLLVLAFFIVLVTISTREDIKSRAVMDSLTTTFTTILPPTSELTIFTSKDGDILAGQQFQDRVTSIFSAAVQVMKVEVLQPGRLMRLRMPADALFFPDGTKIREAQYPLLDRIVVALSSRPPGLRYDMEFVIGSPYATARALSVGQTLEMSRAGVFIRELLARGAPRNSVSVGLGPGRREDVTLWFHTRYPDEEREMFERLAEHTGS